MKSLYKDILAKKIDLYTDWLADLTTNYIDTLIDKNSLKLILATHLENNLDTKKLVSTLGHHFSFWNIDWQWISYHISQDYHSQKKLFEELSFLKRDEKKTLVYKILDKSACEASKLLYLTTPKDINSKPIVFKFEELLGNGSNLFRHKTEWKPTIGVTNFGFYQDVNDDTQPIYDKYYIKYLDNVDDEWNSNTLCFEPSKERKEHLKNIGKFIKTEIKESGAIYVTIDPGLAKYYKSKRKSSLISSLLSFLRLKNKLP